MCIRDREDIVTDAPQQAGYGYLTRPDVAPFIPRGAVSALDVGCSEGGFGESLRSALGSGARLVGVEAVPESAAAARERSSFNDVITGYFPHALDGRDERFDLISFIDVLEHIYDPRDVLVQAKDFLTPDGAVLACLPNIQYLSLIHILATVHGIPHHEAPPRWFATTARRGGVRSATRRKPARSPSRPTRRLSLIHI